MTYLHVILGRNEEREMIRFKKNMLGAFFVIVIFSVIIQAQSRFSHHPVTKRNAGVQNKK